MNIQLAFREMREGKWAKRQEHYYPMTERDGDMAWHDPRGWSTYRIRFADILADDWELCEDPSKPKQPEPWTAENLPQSIMEPVERAYGKSLIGVKVEKKEIAAILNQARTDAEEVARRVFAELGGEK